MRLWSILSLLIMTVNSSFAWTLDFRKEHPGLPEGAVFVEREVTEEWMTVRIHAVLFSAKNFDFEVIDNPTPNQGKLASAVSERPVIAAVNGGYFHENWRPVGLAMANGKTINGFERAKLLSGVFVVTDGVPRIVRSQAYTPAKGDKHALQAGPFLVENGKPTVGLNDTRRARRTVLAWDGKSGWALLIFSSVSLADAAQLLANDSIFPDFDVQSALNLDGGSSSALWIRTGDRPFSIEEVGSVRNYLAISPR